MRQAAEKLLNAAGMERALDQSVEQMVIEKMPVLMLKGGENGKRETRVPSQGRVLRQGLE